MVVVPQGRSRVLAEGSRLGRYIVGKRLARGGMAEVYLGTAEGTRGFAKPVALKLILPAFADEPSFVQMFAAEARLSAQLDHPNIAQVFDVAESEGELFMALEYVHGRTVRAMIKEADDPVPLDVLLHIALQTCDALAYAHTLHTAEGVVEVVHRDVSPSNLMVRYDGGVKLLDFGIAKASSSTQATRSGMLKGKGGYMSPEQCLGLPVDARSDLFAMGILLFEMSTRHRLFVGDNEYDVMNRIVEGKFSRPTKLVEGYPAALERIVVRALQRDPDDRYASAQAMASELRSAAAALNVVPRAEAVAEYLLDLFGPAPPLHAPTLAEPERGGTQVVVAAPPSARDPRVGNRVAWGGLAAVA
ncbi:MAG: serine/threonine-protein kinase, partial [Myxococcota bacterium]